MKFKLLLESKLQTQFKNLMTKKHGGKAYGYTFVVPFSTINGIKYAVCLRYSTSKLVNFKNYTFAGIYSNEYSLSGNYDQRICGFDDVLIFNEDEKTLECFDRFFNDIKDCTIDEVKQRTKKLKEECGKSLGS